MPGLALPTAALRPGKGPSGNNSPAARPVSPAKATLPGTLLPLTGVVSPGASNCSSPVERLGDGKGGECKILCLYIYIYDMCIYFYIYIYIYT